MINRIRYPIENIAKPPIRCNKCKSFDHTIMSCVNQARCGRCGQTEHKDEMCPCQRTLIYKCVNCGENHSSYYKGCKEYKIRYNNSIKESKTHSQPHSSSKTVQAGFFRNYSQVANQSPNANMILEKLTSLENTFRTETKTMTDKFNAILLKVEEKFNEFAKLLTLNNSKIFHFLLYILKILVPTMKKTT